MEKSHKKHDSLKTDGPRITSQDPVRYEGWGVRVPGVQEVSAPPPTHTHSEMRYCGLIDFLEAVIEKDESVGQSFSGILDSLRLRMQARVKVQANLSWIQRHIQKHPGAIFDPRKLPYDYKDLYNGAWRMQGDWVAMFRFSDMFWFGPDYSRPWGLESYS